MTPGAISMAMARLTLTISSSSPIALARQVERRKMQKKQKPGGAMTPGFTFWDLPPNPVTRFAHCRLRLCLQGRGNCERFCEGNGERLLGFMAQSIRAKPSKQTEIQTIKQPYAPPFLVGKGAGGIGLWRRGIRRTQRMGKMKRRWGCGVIRVICVIRLIRDSDTAGRRWARTGGEAERRGTHTAG